MLSCRPTGHGHRPIAIAIATCTATGPLLISRSLSHARARLRDIRGFGGTCSSLELYERLPESVRRLVDEAGFGEFIRTLSPVRNDHAVLVALAERWRDTANTFHLPPGEMTVMPTDFATITGLRVGGEPIPFDSGIQEDRAALEWFLGEVPKIEEGMARYDQFKRYLKKKVTNDQEAEYMAIAYLLYLFGASLYPSRRSKVHLSYLSALRDMRTASRFDWGGAALGATYGFLGDSSRTEQSTAGYWRIWEAQGRAAPRRKSAWDLPKKKVATRTPAPPVTTRRQTRSSQSAAASQEAAREAVACAEMRYRIKMHKKPSQNEPVHKKRLILPASSEEEEEREEEREEEEEGEEEGEEDEERSSTSSGSDDSVDDPGYRKDPKERDDDDDDGDWLAED